MSKGDNADKRLEQLIEKKFAELLGRLDVGGPQSQSKVGKKLREVKVGPLLQSLIDASDRIPSGSRRQGIRFKLGADHIETSIETGLKSEAEDILANTKLGDKMTISRACHALLVLLIEEHRELNG